MLIKEQAKTYAIKVHEGQIRKSNGKPMIYHPITVGEILESFGFDHETISAGYLHDTVEDTKTTINDIERIFGKRVAKLVFNASEPNKTLSWEERKLHTISVVETNHIEDIAVVLADKIHNIENLTEDLKLQGLSILNSFKRGFEKQLWYFEGIYNASLVSCEDHPMVQRLGNAIVNLKSEVHYQTELETDLFVDDKDLLDKLRELHILKYKVKEVGYIRPFVIELLGTPRTGKTTIINNILDFFKKGGFKVSYFKELATSEFYDTVNHLPLYERNMAIIDEIAKQLQSVRSDSFERGWQARKLKTRTIKNDVDTRVFDKTGDIVVFDRGINDRLIWFRRLLDKGEISREQYDEIINRFSEYLDLVNCLLVYTASPEVSLKRDYISSLALEKRSFLTINNVESYNKAMFGLIEDDIIKNHHLIDTNNKTIIDSSIESAKYVLQKISL